MSYFTEEELADIKVNDVHPFDGRFRAGPDGPYMQLIKTLSGRHEELTVHTLPMRKEIFEAITRIDEDGSFGLHREDRIFNLPWVEEPDDRLATAIKILVVADRMIEHHIENFDRQKAFAAVARHEAVSPYWITPEELTTAVDLGMQALADGDEPFEYDVHVTKLILDGIVSPGGV